MKTKKILCLLLVMLIIFQSSSVFSLADEGDGTVTIKEDDETPKADDNDETIGEESENLGTYIVAVPLLNFRKEPSLDSEVEAHLSQGTKLSIEEIENGWGRAVYEDVEGWVMMEYVEYIGYLDKYSVNWKFASLSEKHDEINWAEVENDNLDAVILQIGYCDNGSSEIVKDEKFDDNYTAVLETRLHMGAVFVSSTETLEGAKLEAEWLVENIEKDKLKFDMPVFFDVRALEDSELDKESCTEIVKEFCDYLLDNNYYPGVVLSQEMADVKLNMFEFENYAVWIDEKTLEPSYKARLNLWSYTQNAKIRGIGGHVALGLCYTNFSSFISDKSLNNIIIRGQHIYGEWETMVESTCTSHGLEAINCLHCGIILKSRILPLKDHNIDSDDWETIDNHAQIRCKDCGLIINKQLLPTLDLGHFHIHSDWIKTKEATCESTGEKIIKCLDCDTILLTSFIPPLDHEPDDRILVEPTCTEDGKSVLLCKNCGLQLEFEFLPALGHDIEEWEIEQEPTESEPGLRSGLCTRCGETITERIPSLITRLKGDLNFDGKVTSAEARLILRYSASLETLTEEEIRIADINGDGKVTAQDARLALRIAARLDDEVWL